MALSKNLFYNFLLSLSQVLFPLISIPYISRVLDPQGIGHVSFIDSFTYYFIALAEFGIIVYGVREVAKSRNEPEKLSKLVSELMSLHIITSLCSLVIYCISVYFLWNKFGDPRLILFSVSFLLVNFFACEWYFWGKEEFRYLTFRTIAVRLLGLASIFILIKKPEDYFLYYLVIVASSVIIGIWNIVVLLNEVPINLKGINWRRHIPFLLVTFQISILYSVIIMLDNVLLGLVSTSAAAIAFYSYAVKIVRIGGAVITDMLLVFYPRIVSLIRDKENEKLETLITGSFGFLFLLAMPLGTGIFLLSESFTQLYFGPGFSSVSYNLKILAFYPLLRVLALSLNKQVLMAYEKEKYIVKGLIVSCIFFLISFSVLSYYYSDTGACVAILLTELLILAMNFFYVRKVNIPYKLINIKDVIHALLGSFLFVPVVFLIKRLAVNDLYTILFALVLCAGLYFLFLYFILKNAIVRKMALILKDFIIPKKNNE